MEALAILNPMDLRGRLILVTGASSGIGRETAILLSQLGARLVLVGRDKERLAQTEAQLEGEGHRTQPFDLQRAGEIPGWMKALTSETGVLSGLVHSAGIYVMRPLNILNPEILENALRTNLGASPP